MDKKDEIILQQLETIRTMTERNLRSMGGDFWGTPFENVTGAPEKKPASKDDGGKPAAAQSAEKKADEPGAAPEGEPRRPAGGARQLHRPCGRQGGGQKPHQYGQCL